MKSAATEDTPKGNIAERSFNKLKGTYEELDPQVKKLLATGLGGATLGGGLGYLLSGNRAGESESARRKRVLSNALLGAGLGGVAGAAIPTGLSQIESASQKSDADRLEDALVEYAPPTAAAGAGGLASYLGLDKLTTPKAETVNRSRATLSEALGTQTGQKNDIGSVGKNSRKRNAAVARDILQSGNLDPKDLAKHLRNLGVSTGFMSGLLGQGPSKKLNPNMSLKDFENLMNKLQRNSAIRGGLGRAGVAGAGGLAGLGLYNSIIG
ncbi:MAG: hypothetical protein EBY39_11570 [Flavobacteriia bacterium]|nr:hypothetical protein [Flavobacteriia bacterium]